MFAEAVEEAAHEIGFCGNYLVQKAAAFHWVEDEHTKLYLMREMVKFAERIQKAAACMELDLQERAK